MIHKKSTSAIGTSMFYTIFIIYVIRYLVHCNSNGEKKKKNHYAKHLRFFFATLLGLTISSAIFFAFFNNYSRDTIPRSCFYPFSHQDVFIFSGQQKISSSLTQLSLIVGQAFPIDRICLHRLTFGITNTKRQFRFSIYIFYTATRPHVFYGTITKYSRVDNVCVWVGLQLFHTIFIRSIKLIYNKHISNSKIFKYSRLILNFVLTGKKLSLYIKAMAYFQQLSRFKTF